MDIFSEVRTIGRVNKFATNFDHFMAIQVTHLLTIRIRSILIFLWEFKTMTIE